MTKPITGFTKGEAKVVHEEKWPFGISIYVGYEEVVSMGRIAYSTSQNTLADMRSAKGFSDSEKKTIINIINKQEANADLIAEAFNVATETGLTPRQLAEQVKILRELCEIFIKEWDNPEHDEDAESFVHIIAHKGVVSKMRNVLKQTEAKE